MHINQNLYYIKEYDTGIHTVSINSMTAIHLTVN